MTFIENTESIEETLKKRHGIWVRAIKAIRSDNPQWGLKEAKEAALGMSEEVILILGSQ